MWKIVIKVDFLLLVVLRVNLIDVVIFPMHLFCYFIFG